MNRIEYAGLAFTDDDDGYEIKSASCHKVCALLSDSLEVDSFDSVLISDTPLTPFERNAPLTWHHRGQPVGTYFVQQIKRIKASEYRIEATSNIGLLMQSDHYGGIYTGQTVADVVADICTVPYAIKTSLQGIKLYGWLPNASRRDNLSQVLFAIGATAKTDYSGVLRIGGLWSGTSGEITDDRVFLGDSVEYASDVTEVIVLEHQYVEGAEEDTLFEGTALSGDIITFSEPMHSLSAQGFTILESGANYAKLSAGSGTLTGKKYIHTTRAVPKPVSQSDQPSTVTVKDATLVSLANSEAVASRLVNYYSAIETVEHDIVRETELPGDVVTLNHPYDEAPVSGCIESMDMDLSGKLRATQRVLLGYVPPDIGDTEYYDTAEIITEDGVWTAPEGVESARAVLIGGGSGGDSGKSGVGGKSNAGEGGSGGDAGAAGVGGRVFSVTLDLHPGDTFDVSIGKGGKGAEHNPAGASGLPGTNTAFGIHSSASGASSDIGFADPFTGDVHAKKGTAGFHGGKGGSGGGVGIDGGDGENVDQFNGGKGASAREWWVYAPPPGGGGDYIYYTMKAGGGGGGGAAFGEDGNDGTRGSGSGNLLIDAGGGGNGGNAANALIAVNRGSGGNGGHGGGGGGGSSAAINVRNPGQIWYRNGAGGKGSAGSDGADGCVIIYYRIPKPVQRGAVKDKNGRYIRDRYGRQLVV